MKNAKAHTIQQHWVMGMLSLTSWVQGCLEDASSIKFLTKLVLRLRQYDQVIA